MRVAFVLASRHLVSEPGSGQGKLFAELGVVTDTQYRLGLETWRKGLNLSPENIDAWNRFRPLRHQDFLEKDTDSTAAKQPALTFTGCALPPWKISYIQ